MQIIHADEPSKTFYAKPLPLTDEPSWGDDAVDMEVTSESSRVYAAEVADGAWMAFEQAGETPANSDEPVRLFQAAAEGGGIGLSDEVPTPGEAETVGRALRQTLDYLDAPISGIGGVSGDGPDAVTLQITDDQSNPIADCSVWIFSDSDMQTLVAGPKVTGDTGLVTFNLQDGLTYYAVRRKSGMTFTNPASFEAEAD